LLRLFAAIEVPPDIGEGLLPRQTGILGARWRPVDALHITLRFFGDVPENKADDLDAELATIRGRPLDLVIDGAGAFGEGPEIHAVWAGVEENKGLRQLAARCEASARKLHFRPEKRIYKPHVTLAYLKGADPERVAVWIQGHNMLKSPCFRMAAFGLYSSWQGPEGSYYRLEREYALSP
jgi:2'-5' RNA ligase